MNVDATGQRERARRSTPLMAGWLLGVGLTAAMGWIHLRLWMDGFRDVPVIGVLFLVNVIGAGLLVVALLVVPARVRGAVAAVAAVFTAGTLLGLILSLTVGLFGTQESLLTPYVPTTLMVESVGVLILVFTAVLEARTSS